MIAIFTHRRGTEADRVIRHLRTQGFDPVRINMGTAEAEATLAITNSRIHGLIECDGRSINPTEIRVAWLHQPPPLQAKTTAPIAEIAAESSRLRMWEAILGLVTDERWITTPPHVARAGSKAVQYMRAVDIGLPIPQTILSNAPSSIRPAVPALPLMKFLGDTSRLWSVDDEGYSTLTVETSLANVDDDMIRRAPAIYQARVVSASEVRVVAIATAAGTEGSVFAASAIKPAGIADIRSVENGLARYTPCGLPGDVRSRLFRLLRALNVGFCSADLIVTPEGEHVFVDLNATGAWWWIDDLYEGAVTRSIAQTLVLRSGSA